MIKRDFEAFERPLESGEGWSDLRETIQFQNGLTAILMRSIGQTLSWAKQKHAQPEKFDNCTVVSTDDGKRIAVGAGVLAFLPELDLEHGRFVGDHDPSGHGINAIEIGEVAPKGLQDVTVGDDWLTPGSKVNSVMIRYKAMPLGSVSLQADMTASPLESAQHILHRTSQDLRFSSAEPGEFVVPSPPPLYEEFLLPIPGRS